jgi:hypothetical protein
VKDYAAMSMLVASQDDALLNSLVVVIRNPIRR